MDIAKNLKMRVAQVLTSEWLHESRRVFAEKIRVLGNTPHRVHYFHQVNDPYSALIVQILERFVRDYDIELIPHLVSAPSDSAAPEREKLEAYSRRDAAAIAPWYRVSFQDRGVQPPPQHCELAIRALAKSLDQDFFVHNATGITRALWEGDEKTLLNKPMISLQEAQRELAAGDRSRQKSGHYLGGTFYYAGEWYWGLDRLHYLTERLSALGAARSPGARHWMPPEPDPAAVPCENPQAIDFYISLRSPYSYISIPRVQALAERFNTELRLKPVLPMVMRNLPVPANKIFYITRDVKREALRRGFLFGKTIDPVGSGVERGMAVLIHAIRCGRGPEFAFSFTEGAFGKGIDAATDTGLRQMVESAGLDWTQAREWVEDPGWRDVVEKNRQEMFSLGLWGVPSFRVGHFSTWGQDRLWLVAHALSSGQKEPSGRDG